MNLPRMQLTAGEHSLQVYVARSDEERAQGLMHRRELPPDEGMLFVCDACQVLSFWMKDTPLPLSIAFLREDGTVLKVADLQPHDLEGESSEHAVRFVLEVNQGWFDERALGPGVKFDGPVFLAGREGELRAPRG
ncbi:DUF192 domain-containing protein [Ramlibacter sp. AN1133]|uniref:DUF192 domain-containing protein n=1 Tax=Ramlibacter sp. AN1133 TaxID=3133429 RepID=UPI0030C0C4E4